MTSKHVIIVMIFAASAVSMIAPPMIANADPTWKPYSSVDCGLTLDYPAYKGSFIPPKIEKKCF